MPTMIDFPSLAGLDDVARRSILAEAVLAELDQLPEHGGLVGAVRREAQEHLLAERGAIRDPAAVSELLAQTLRRSVLPAEQIEAVKRGLGRKGELPPRDYDLVLAPTFDRRGGMSPNAAFETVREPDAVQHVLLPPEAGRDDVSLSYFAKVIEPRRSSEYVSLVEAHRSETRIAVRLAWRVQPSLVPLTWPARPLDVLKAFVLKYGMGFQVLGNPELHFLLVSMKMKPVVAKSTDVFKLTNVPSQGQYSGGQTISTFAFRGSKEDIRIAMAYAIDVTRYLDDLRAIRVI